MLGCSLGDPALDALSVYNDLFESLAATIVYIIWYKAHCNEHNE
jgi:hypothetical protein